MKERRLRESLELHKRRVLLVKILQLFRYITFVFLMRVCVCVCVCVLRSIRRFDGIDLRS